MTKEDYADINALYTERCDTEKSRKEKLARELELMRAKPSERYLWLQDFIRHGNLIELTRVAAIEMIYKVRVYEVKRIEVCLFNQDDMETLIDSITVNEIEGAVN